MKSLKTEKSVTEQNILVSVRFWMLYFSEGDTRDRSFLLCCYCLKRRLFISALLMVVMAVSLQWKRSSYYKNSRHSIFWAVLHTAKSIVRGLTCFFFHLLFSSPFSMKSLWFCIIVLEVSTRHLQTSQAWFCSDPLIRSVEETCKKCTIIKLWSECW